MGDKRSLCGVIKEQEREESKELVPSGLLLVGWCVVSVSVWLVVLTLVCSFSDHQFSLVVDSNRRGRCVIWSYRHTMGHTGSQ